MPFKSEAQRRFMWSQHPEIARRWTNEMKRGGSMARGGFPFKKDEKEDEKKKAREDAIARRLSKKDNKKKDKDGY